LREDRGDLTPVGLFDLDRRLRPVGEAYRQLIAAWGEVLPSQSLCLQIPLEPLEAEWALLKATA
jgi:beta-glucosidase